MAKRFAHNGMRLPEHLFKCSAAHIIYYVRWFAARASQVYAPLLTRAIFRDTKHGKIGTGFIFRNRHSSTHHFLQSMILPHFVVISFTMFL
jgi:hypothetical protein